MPQITPKKARKNQWTAFTIASIVFIFFVTLVWKIQDTNPQGFYILLAIGLLTSYSTYTTFTAKYRNRHKVLLETFPEAWRKILNKNVVFYNSISKEEQKRFEQNIQIFLSEVRITGIQTEIDDKIRLLVASSAIIPIFGFEEWEYDNLGEVLIYPHTFSKGFETEGKDRNVLGMVGTGVMRRVMILSKKALLDGFANNKDGENTAIHEFVHLIDGSDGHFDGIPAFLDKQYIKPWLDLVYEEIEKIRKEDSSINPYGATSKVEFFAVASEYFFEKPHLMKKNYPELYQMLSRIFHQDLTNQVKYQIRDLVGYTGQRIGRNEPCPCNSGKKYKKCCLD